MSDKNQDDHNKEKRSSLKNTEPMNSQEILDYGKKRSSVSWKENEKLNFPEVKAKFNIENKEESEHDKKFKEARRKSIKNEFSLAKELLKNNKEILEIDENEDIKENTQKNEHIKDDSDGGK